MAASGYLVVLLPDETSSLRNSHYRGIDRLPFVTIDSFDPDDPMWTSRFWDLIGLIPTRALANEVMSGLMRRRPHEALEIIAVDEVIPPFTGILPSDLGFDVAGSTSPFYSLLLDFPPDAEMQPFRHRLNTSGLFSVAADAAEYLDAYRRLQLADFDLPYSIWKIRADG